MGEHYYYAKCDQCAFERLSRYTDVLYCAAKHGDMTGHTVDVSGPGEYGGGDA